MAAVTRVKGRPCTPVGYERVREKKLGVTLTTAGSAGQVVTCDGTNWALATAAATVAHGILLMNCAAGIEPEVGIVGEMDGFSGMTPYTDLYVDATTDGEIGTTKPTGGVLQMRSVSATRIAYDFGP